MLRLAIPEQWQPGDVAILQNQEVKTVRQLGVLILDTSLQRDYESGVDVRTLLPAEKVDEVNGDVGMDGERYVKFETHDSPT